MKKSLLALVLMAVSSTVFAGGASEFCAPLAEAAAKALANSNGSISQNTSSSTRDGKVFSVVLSEEGTAKKDAYTVETEGGHDCIVFLVKVNGRPTLRP
jgi:hypothetical protein